jgi:cell division septal protein FtsQ
VKRPDGFDERPEQPVAPEPDAVPTRQPARRSFADRLGRARGGSRPAAPAPDIEADPADDLEALLAPGASAPESSGARSPRDLPDLPDPLDDGRSTRTGDDDDRDDDTWLGSNPRSRGERPSRDEVRAVLTGAAGTAGRGLGKGFRGVASRLRDLSPDEDFVDPDAPRRTAADGAGASTASRSVAGERAAETAAEAKVARRRRKLMERQEIRRFTRRSRHRRAAWITAGAVVLVLVLSVVVAVYSPLMALTTIKVEGTSRIDKTQVQQALDSQLGTPLARLDFGTIKQELAGFPLIESYVTEEAPPHTLVVTITEREPIVAVKTSSGFALVDPAGITVESTPSKPANLPLAGVDPSQIGGSVYRTMTDVVLALPTSLRPTVTEVTATTADDVTLTLNNGSKVVWGSPDDSDQKAALLAALVKDHEARDPSTKVEYDVSAPDNGIIRSQQ